MEFELKLEIPLNRVQQVEAAMREGKTTRQRLRARYFDTVEGALASHGLIVRVRKEGRRWVQTAKGSTSDLLERLEHNVNLTPPAGRAMPVADLTRHTGTPVGDRILQALKLKSDALLPPLIALYDTDVQRLTRRVEVEGSVVEIALDLGRIVSGSHSIALCELEVELKLGQAGHAVQVARDWCARHGLWLSTISKSGKGQRLGHASPLGPVVYATASEFDHRASAVQISVAVLQSCLVQVLGNASEVAGGSKDADHIHQLRVGIRRLRTALGELPALVEGIDTAWEGPLVEAFRALGRHRDYSHMVTSLLPQIAAAGGPALQVQHDNKDIPDPGVAIRMPAFQDALLGVIGFLHSVVTANGSPNHKVAKKILEARLKKLRTQVVKDGKKFLALDEIRQHKVRKRLKRLRYLTEFSAPLFAARQTRAFVTSMKPVQNALGHYNDELMALEAFRTLVSSDKQAWFGIGWLSARRNPNANICLEALEAFATVKPYWD